MAPFIFAIDGGGTSCRAAVADRDGKILGRAKHGPANIVTDRDHAVENIVAAASDALRESGLAPEKISTIPAYLGLAGANIKEHCEGLDQQLPFAKSHFAEDYAIAVQGALGDSDGAVGLMGTGSVFMARREGKLTKIGGWGFLLSDIGSGAQLGHALLRRTLLAHDGIVPATPLTQQAMGQFEDNPDNIVAFARSQRPSAFARFAAMVFEFADAGDANGQEIVDDAVDHVNEALDAVTWAGCDRLCLMGGLSIFYGHRLPPRHQKILNEPLGDAVDGAVALANKLFQPN